MSKLWIYGDSFAQDHQVESQWHRQYFAQSYHCDLVIHAQAGVANDWISTEILNTHTAWNKGDQVIVIPTQPNRQWWFPEYPHMSNINSMWGHPLAQDIEAKDKNRVDAVGYYMNFLQRDDIDQLRARQMLAWMSALAVDIDLIIIPAFDLGFSACSQCKGNLTDVCNAEFFDQRSRQRYYQQGTDLRLNHLSSKNHTILANKLIQEDVLDLTQGFQTGFLV